MAGRTNHPTRHGVRHFSPRQAYSSMPIGFLRDRPDHGKWQKIIEAYDPLEKIHLYGDERCAAEDAAYVYFKVWQFPVDAPYILRAADFDGRRWFEKHVLFA